MNAVVALAVLIAGLVLGYFVGDYKGRADRAALVAAIEAAHKAELAMNSLKQQMNRDIAAIRDKARQDLDSSQRQFDSSEATWAAEKSGLQARIGLQTDQIAANKVRIQHLKDEADRADPAEKARLRAQIDAKTRENALLMAERDGSACLTTSLPSSVKQALSLGS